MKVRTTTSMADTDYENVHKLVDNFGWKLTTSNKAMEDLDPSTVVPLEVLMEHICCSPHWNVEE
eukprot:1875996-Amphidinium_carterae.1